MTDNRRRILNMLAEGKITADEAERLLMLVDQPNGVESGNTESSEGHKPSPKYLRVVVLPDEAEGAGSESERVNIRVPMALIRAGVKLASVLPSDASQKVNEALEQQGLGIDLRNLKSEDLEQLVEALADLEVDIQDDHQRVRVYVE